ncbi:MAG TPA: PrsW family glutamic-type intramembrane protease [Bacteroidota bacterium]|nr:PrsW family glutamic-type intramembrane protease [Bacteroidota bacterium]
MIYIYAFIPAFLIISLFYFLDKHKEPVKAVVHGFVWGCASILVLFALRWAVYFNEPAQDGTFVNAFLTAFLFAGVLEEAAKMFIFIVAISTYKEFDEWYDGIFYGLCVGVGFAFVENILYYNQYFAEAGMMIVYRRSLFSMPMHALLGGTMGFFLGKAKFHAGGTRKFRLIILAFLAPVVLHGLFDLCLMSDFLRSIGWLITAISVGMWIYVIRLKQISQTSEVSS